MTASDRATANSVRSANLAYFLPPDWGRIANHIIPTFERISRDSEQVQCLILVPDSAAAVALARAIGAIKTLDGLRVVAATSSPRAQRLLAGSKAHVVIGSPATLAPVVTATALKLEGLTTLVLAAADEFDAESSELATIVAEVPRNAGRILTALHATAGVESLLERYFHRARRVTDDVGTVEATDGTTEPVKVRYLTVVDSPVASIPLILDDIDPPSAAVIATDPKRARAARALLTDIGYTDDALVSVTEGEVAPNTALVISLGVPGSTIWGAMLAAQPAQIVAIVSARDIPALELLVGDAGIIPFGARGSVQRARAADARARAELRDTLSYGIPSREVLALEPLLGEYDGLEIAAAALRLLETTRTAQTELVNAAEHRVRTIMKQAQKEREERESAEGGRGPRPGGFGPPRGDRPRDDRPPRGEFRPREDRPRDDRPPRSGDDRPPREFRPRDDRKPGFGARDRDSKPGFGSRDRDSRPGSGSRDRDSRPSYGSRDRDSKPGFGSRDRDGKPGFGRDRDSRPSSGPRGGSGKPKFGDRRPPRGDR